jgi:hypothetical protein
MNFAWPKNEGHLSGSTCFKQMSEERVRFNDSLLPYAVVGQAIDDIELKRIGNVQVVMQRNAVPYRAVACRGAFRALPWLAMVPWLAVQCRAEPGGLPWLTVQWLALQCRAVEVPCRYQRKKQHVSVPCRGFVPCRGLPCRAVVSRDPVPGRGFPCHAMPCFPVPYRVPRFPVPCRAVP